MKETIEDCIRNNENFRQDLLKQDGGIMKYLAEYLSESPESYVDIEFLGKYRKLYYEIFLKENRGNYEITFLDEDEKKRKAFGYDHLSKELSYQIALRPVLAQLPEEIAEEVNSLIYKYMEYAWMENRRFYYPDGTPNIVLYEEIIHLYSPNGIAHVCMDHLLREHHNPQVWAKRKSEYSLYDEFLIRQYSVLFYKHGWYKRLRQAVKEMTDSKTKEECRQMAFNTMMVIKHFSRMLYSTSETHITDCTGSYQPDKEWLRKVARDSILCSKKQKVHFLHSCFSHFVLMLNEIGRIWAAQLLIHGIDMHELEKETGCILFPVSEPTDWPDGLNHGNYRYYVDKDINMLDDDCCINNEEQAKVLLEKIRNKSAVNPPEELLTAEAQPYWKKLREGGFIVADGYALAESISANQAAYIADRMAEKLQIKNKWKLFQQLWGIPNLAQLAGSWKQTGKLPPDVRRIDDIFK